ncbi:MarR family winged helix-turn-helix transcriptional regulator [Guptibacillus algicola]|uniref:MarR family winged helix-turn-helix transcriptional regulator n=1 Tax=Guptibacillus algicola TaxID=225844 RepID=UPI001CD53C39|nr:MarR family transcriptional regulator [Alkalihalobacillus algicola]MCA0989315.1 MarR family transcriptional regulator [Alkalihalobacillus algicola]
MISTNDIFHSLNQKVRLITKEANEKLKEYNLYSSQWAILYCLDQYGPMKQTDIWQYLNVEAPTTTRTLARMESNHWICRSEGKDKRERIVYLTDYAESKLPAIKNAIFQLEKSLLSHLTEDEQVQFMNLLNKIEFQKEVISYGD